jgi:hypothetical protein
MGCSVHWVIYALESSFVEMGNLPSQGQGCGHHKAIVGTGRKTVRLPPPYPPCTQQDTQMALLTPSSLLLMH